MNGKPKPLVVLLVCAETSPATLYGLFDVLYSVGVVYPDMTVGTPGPAALDVRIVAAEAAAFRCLGDVLVEPHASIDAIERADAIVVCDLYTPVDRPPPDSHAREVAWLRRQHEAGALVTSICSGSLLLAEAGLLDGRPATGHWAYEALFRRHYPKVRYQRAGILCRAAEGEGIVTAGGVTAWMELALYLVARLCGPRQAIETAKIFLLGEHSAGQLPYASMVQVRDGSDAVIGACQTWIAEHYDVPNPVEQMTEHSGLHPRTFARRFRAATGYAPIDYVQALRVEEAKQMLEADDLGLEEIGATVGYEDAASFRRVFRRRAGLTPAAYRRKFRSIAMICAPASEPRFRPDRARARVLRAGGA